jgi:olfactory receptor
MTFGNFSFVTEFILEGLTDQSGLQLPLFFLFLVIYVVTALGNLSLIINWTEFTLSHSHVLFSF